MRVCLISILLCFTPHTYAQKWQQVNYNSFLKEYSHLLEIQPASMYRTDITTSVFRTFSDPQPKVTQKSVLKVYSNNNYFYSSEATFQIQNGNLRLDIDTNERQAILSDGVSSELMGFKKGQFDGIDSTIYRFYAATEGNKRFLKVEEVQQVSSMQTVCFVFDKSNAPNAQTSNKISRLEMVYWPANYTQESLDDESLEQPKIILDYSGYSVLSSTEELTQTFNKWLVKESAKQYSCPKTDYTFHNLLEKKR